MAEMPNGGTLTNCHARIYIGAFVDLNALMRPDYTGLQWRDRLGMIHWTFRGLISRVRKGRTCPRQNAQYAHPFTTIGARCCAARYAIQKVLAFLPQRFGLRHGDGLCLGLRGNGKIITPFDAMRV